MFYAAVLWEILQSGKQQSAEETPDSLFADIQLVITLLVQLLRSVGMTVTRGMFTQYRLFRIAEVLCKIRGHEAYL